MDHGQAGSRVPAGLSIQFVESNNVTLSHLLQSYGRIRKAGAGGGCSVFRRALSCPIFKEALKIVPTGIKPPSRCAATAASPIEAIQPHDLQSGFPPN